MARVVAMAFAVALAAPASQAKGKGDFKHAAPATAEAGAPLRLELRAASPKKVRRARLRFRRVGESAYGKIDLESRGKKWFATLPGAEVQAPGLEYYIVIQRTDGAVLPVFGDPRLPHRVEIAQRDPPPRGDPGREDAPAGEGTPVDAGVAAQAFADDVLEDGVLEDDVLADDAPEGGALRGDSRAPLGEAEAASAADSGLGGVVADEERASGPGGRGASLPPTSRAESPLSDPAMAEDDFQGAAAADRVERRIPGGGLDGAADWWSIEAAAYGAEAPTFSRVARPPEHLFRSVSRWTREEIRGLGARTLLDVLGIMPGISVSRDVAGFDLVTLRGVRGDARVPLVIDGHVMRNPLDARAFWRFPADLIESVEVIRGADGATREDSALSGTVRVTTRRQPGASLHTFAGSFDTWGINASAAGELGAVEWRGGAQWMQSAGPQERIARDAFSSSGVNRPLELMRTHAQGSTTHAYLGGTLRLGGELSPRIYAQAQVAAEERGPYFGAFDTLGETSRLGWWQWGGDVGIEVPMGEVGTWDTRIQVDQNGVDRLFQVSPRGASLRNADGVPESFAPGVLAFVGYTTLQANAQTQVALHPGDGNTLRLGVRGGLAALPAEGYLLAMNRDPTGRPTKLEAVPGLPLPENDPCQLYGAELTALGACRLTLQAWITDQWSPHRWWAFEAGAGVHAFSDASFSVGSHIRPRLGVAFTPSSDIALRAALSGGVRPPTWEERFDQLALSYIDFSAGGYVGNPDLVPESQLNAELGLAYGFRAQGVAYQLDGVLFASRLSDAIERIDTVGSVEQAGNRGDVEQIGAEAGLRARFPAGSAFANVSWVRSYFRAPTDLDPENPRCALVPALPGEEPCTLLTHTPQLRANLGLRFGLGVLGELSTWTEVHSARQNNARSPLERLRPFQIPSFALVNAAYRSPRLWERVGLEARVFNLLDVDHLDDVPRPDRMPGLLPREGVALYAGIVADL